MNMLKSALILPQFSKGKVSTSVSIFVSLNLEQVGESIWYVTDKNCLRAVFYAQFKMIYILSIYICISIFFNNSLNYMC